MAVGGGSASLEEPAAPARGPGAGEGGGPPRWQQVFARGAGRQEAVVFGVLIALLAGFSIARPENFLTTANMQNLARDGSILLILAVGITYVTVMGMFDLSIGSVLVFSQVVAVKLMGSLGGEGLAVICAGLAIALAAGAAWGLLNGLLVALLDLSPFLVTLATLGAALGAAQLISGGQDLTTIPVDLSTTIGIDKIAGIPWLVAIAAAIALIGGIQLARSRFGQFTYAIGSNRQAAARAGIGVTRHIVASYILVGFLAGVAGYLDAARFGTTSVAGHGNDALAAITAVALGGASLYGGRGTMLGTVIGVSIPAVLLNGLVILETQTYWYEIIVAVALVLSIYLDRRRRSTEHR